MNLSLGMVVGAAALLVLTAVVLGVLVRARRGGRRSPRAQTRPPHSADPRRAGRGGFVPLDDRIGSWTDSGQSSAAVLPPNLPSATPPTPPTPPTPAPHAEQVLAAEASPLPGYRVPERHLIAPVELWFGETRIGVISGSDAHEQFAHYADELLSDLPAGGDGE